MTPQRLLVLLTGCCLLIGAANAEGERCLSSPWALPSQVDEDGVLHEDWGAFALHLVQPEGVSVTERSYEKSPFPKAMTVKTAGSVTLTETAYRSPIWPAGVDVLEAVIANPSDATVKTELVVTIPENVSFGQHLGIAGGRAALSFPEDIKLSGNEREWGFVEGGLSMPGWGSPIVDCDPAFRNIRAGMGGQEIVYRFAVIPGTGKKVVLGFCESFWDISGHRPLVINVEGTEKTECDPISSWGHHMPGCLPFEAVDRDGDGRIEISIEPHPKAGDKNPILNAIWVFPPDSEIDLGEVIAGKKSSEAEVYVDVGGEKDQGFYEGGTLSYTAKLGPKSEKTLVFLLGCPGGGTVPNPEDSTWTPSSLRKAAADVWAGVEE